MYVDKMCVCTWLGGGSKRRRRKGMQDGDESSREEKVTRAAGCWPKAASDGGLRNGHRVKIIRDMNLRSAHSNITFTPGKRRRRSKWVGNSDRNGGNERLKIRQVTV